MASFLYNNFKEDLLDGTWNPAAGTITCVLADSATATIPAQDAATPVYSDLASAGLGQNSSDVVVTATLGTPTYTDGVLDASTDTSTFTAVDGGGARVDSCNRIVIYQATTNILMGVIELGSAVTFTGGDVIVDWDDTTSMNGQTGGVFAI